MSAIVRQFEHSLILSFFIIGMKIDLFPSCGHDEFSKFAGILSAFFFSFLPPQVHLVKTVVFPVVMYGCESWTVKKAERWRIDGFELWC